MQTTSAHEHLFGTKHVLFTGVVWWGRRCLFVCFFSYFSANDPPLILSMPLWSCLKSISALRSHTLGEASLLAELRARNLTDGLGQTLPVVNHTARPLDWTFAESQGLVSHFLLRSQPEGRFYTGTSVLLYQLNCKVTVNLCTGRGKTAPDRWNSSISLACDLSREMITPLVSPVSFNALCSTLHNVFSEAPSRSGQHS